MDQVAFDARFDGIAFVTTPVARDRMGVPDQFTLLASLAGKHFVELELDEPIDAIEARRKLHRALRQARLVRGIVLLGNYDELPPLLIQCIDDVTLKILGGEGTDLDGWSVYADAIYGQGITPTVPVSRLPMVPSTNELLPQAVPILPDDSRSLGLRSSEFDFVDNLFLGLPNSAGFGLQVSPPMQSCVFGVVPGCLQAGGLEADYQYLMLHGQQARNSEYQGEGVVQGGLNGNVVAVDRTDVLAGAYPGSTIFSGVCWGGNINRFETLNQVTGEFYLAPFDAQEYLALLFVDRGASAYAGFTGAHWVPTTSEPTQRYSVPLHQYFWEYLIDQRLPPALALFRARRRALQEVTTTAVDWTDFAGLMKSYWSAVCLGIGW